MKTIINYSIMPMIVAVLAFTQSFGQNSVTILAGPPAYSFPQLNLKQTTLMLKLITHPQGLKTQPLSGM
jgi:hypothetical protein